MILVENWAYDLGSLHYHLVVSGLVGYHLSAALKYNPKWTLWWINEKSFYILISTVSKF